MPAHDSDRSLEHAGHVPHAGDMESDSRRQDLYTGLTGILGPDLTASLMSFIPPQPAADLATKADVQSLSDQVGALTSRIDRLSDRMDRLQTTLLGGFAAMIAALLAAGFVG